MDMPKSAANNHGFSLLGERSLVLSHIPMFMAPHQFQIFLEVTIDGPAGSDPVKAYLDDRKKSGTTDYVLVTDPIVLAELAPDAPHRLTKFTGKLFRGWPFNNPNTAPVIVPALTVHVTRAIYYHSILHQPLLQNLTYLAFHTPECDYLVHELVQPPDLKHVPDPPDFIQVLDGRVTGAAHDFHTGAVKIAFPHAANDVAHKLTAGKSAEGKSGSHEVKVEAHQELVFDPNHLMPV